MVCRTPSRFGRGRRAAVAFVVCFGWGSFFVFFSFVFFLFERTRPGSSMRPPCLIYLSTSKLWGELYTAGSRTKNSTDESDELLTGRRNLRSSTVWSLCLEWMTTFLALKLGDKSDKSDTAVITIRRGREKKLLY